MALSEREQHILATIVEAYIADAAPVGSTTAVRRSGLKLSPASMRNSMSALAEKGYLDQPHTSAGRVPTAEAFRLYLDRTLATRPRATLGVSEQRRIADELAHGGSDLAELLERASRVLARFARQVSVVLAPDQQEVRWREIEFAPVRKGLVLVVLVLDGGMVQNRLVSVDQNYSNDDLTLFANYLNDHYRGRTLSEVRAMVYLQCSGARRELKELYRRAVELARSAVEGDEERKLYMDGALRILEQDGFGDLETLREVMRFLDERTRLLGLLDRAIAKRGVTVLLGDEGREQPGEVSLISSPYGTSETPLGAVGIIGPMRMDYQSVLPVVDFVAKELTQLLKNRF